MATTTSPNTEAAIWTRIVHPEGELTSRSARAILQVGFQQGDRERMRALAAKAREGLLTPEEEIEIDSFERVGHLLSTLKSKARKVLKKTRRHS
ncbi:MAG: hypothetical protein HY721_04295 [Planctomycetes bacterium]|nr:hypothetical protein [Planctomycetota bacterium]